MSNQTPPPTPEHRSDWNMEAVFRERNSAWKYWLRVGILLAVLAACFWLYWKMQKPPVQQLQNSPAAESLAELAADSMPAALPPTEKPTEKSAEKLAEKPVEPPIQEIDMSGENAPAAAAPSNFSELAHDLFTKNGRTLAPAGHPLRRGISNFQNGKFAAAATVFEAVLDSSSNEKIAAEADYLLLLALLGDLPKSQAKYQEQLDRLLEQKNHSKFREAGEVKRAASRLF